jgi:hypothetical protein
MHTGSFCLAHRRLLKRLMEDQGRSAQQGPRTCPHSLAALSRVMNRPSVVIVTLEILPGLKSIQLFDNY